MAGGLFCKDRPEDASWFQGPTPPDSTVSTAELERAKKKALEKLAAQEAQLTAVLQELDETRKKAETAEKKAAELSALGAQPPHRRPPQI